MPKTQQKQPPPRKSVVAFSNAVDRIANVRQASTTDANLALAGLSEMADTILDSGIPEVILLFAATYKLIDGIAQASQEAEVELRNPLRSY